MIGVQRSLRTAGARAASTVTSSSRRPLSSLTGALPPHRTTEVTTATTTMGSGGTGFTSSSVGVKPPPLQGCRIPRRLDLAPTMISATMCTTGMVTEDSVTGFRSFATDAVVVEGNDKIGDGGVAHRPSEGGKVTVASIEGSKMSELLDEPADDLAEEEEMEQEDMFVEPHPCVGVDGRPPVMEWGGPTRGGRLAEPTRFGDWERKGRCTDF